MQYVGPGCPVRRELWVLWLVGSFDHAYFHFHFFFHFFLKKKKENYLLCFFFSFVFILIRLLGSSVLL